MYFDYAISTHARWKSKLRLAIAKRETLDVETIGKDNCCDLGKWLYGGGDRLYSSKPEFTKLVASHKGFHIAAARVAVVINSMQFEVAEHMLGDGSTFSESSAEVVAAINGLKQTLA